MREGEKGQRCPVTGWTPWSSLRLHPDYSLLGAWQELRETISALAGNPESNFTPSAGHQFPALPGH